MASDDGFAPTLRVNLHKLFNIPDARFSHPHKGVRGTAQGRGGSTGLGDSAGQDAAETAHLRGSRHRR